MKKKKNSICSCESFLNVSMIAKVRDVIGKEKMKSVSLLFDTTFEILHRINQNEFGRKRQKSSSVEVLLFD